MKNHPYAVNLSKVCRLCFVEKTDLSPIFDNSNIPDLPLQIKQCVSIEVSNDDQLPNQICNDCFKEISNWVNFKQKCNEADTDLKEYVQNAEVKEESDEDSESETVANCSSPRIETIFVSDDDSGDDQTDQNDVMDLDMDTSSENLCVELVSPEELVVEEQTSSADQLKLYKCEICHDNFTSRDDLFSHKMSCYLEPDQSKAVKDQNLISNELVNESSDELSHKPGQETDGNLGSVSQETSFNDPFEKAGVDQGEISGSVSHKSPGCVSEADDEPSIPLNDHVKETDSNQNQISGSVSHESPFRISEKNDEPSIPLSDPVKEADTDQNQISGLMSSKSPFRVPAPDNETSKSLNNPVKETDVDEVEFRDLVSCKSPLRVSEPNIEISTPFNNSVEETDTDQDDIFDSISCKSPLRVSELDNETSKNFNPVEDDADQVQIPDSVNCKSTLRCSEPNNETSLSLNNSIEETNTDQDDIFDSISCKSPLRVCEPNNESSKPLNNPVKEADDQVQIPDSLSYKSPLQVCEPNDEISTAFNNSIEETNTDRDDIFDSISCKSPLRVSEPDIEISKPLNPAEDDADPVEIPDSISYKSPLRSSEPDNDTSSPLNNSVEETDTDQDDAFDLVSYACEAVYEPVTETETDQKSNPPMSYKSPQHISEIDYETSSANEATDHSMDYNLPSDEDQIDSKLGILHRNKTRSESMDEPIHTNSASKSIKKHIPASFSNDNLDSSEDVEEISIEIDLDEISEPQDHTSQTENSRKSRKSHRCNKCYRNFSTYRALNLHNRLAPHCKGRFKCKQCDYRGKHAHNLKYHIVTEHKRGLFTCEICGKVLNNRISLQSHLRFVHSNKKNISRKRTKTSTAEHVCDYCQKTFMLKRNLRKHIINHIYAYKCDQCDRSLATGAALMLHKRSHSSAYWLKCEKCDFTADIRKKINDHMLKEHGTEGSVNCDTCSESFKNKLSLLEHRRKAHLTRRTRSKYIPNESGEFVCEYCQKTFHAKINLANHIQWLHKIQEIACDICGKSCRNKNFLRLHNLDVHVKPFKCEICDYRCGRKTNLEMHFRSHIGDKPKKLSFTCDLCNKTFARWRNLRQHEKLIHESSDKFTCDHCQQTFRLKYALSSHITRVHVLIFKCDICSKGFESETALNDHKTTHTSGELDEPKKFVCDVCGRKCTTQGHLSSHQRTHSVQLLTCEICGYETKKMANLQYHFKAIHIGEKTFYCKRCQKSFVKKSDLNRHLENVHGDKIVACKLCKKCFISKGYLDLHMQKVHVGIFVCKLCKTSFTTQTRLNDHLRDVHGDRFFRCEYCPIRFEAEIALRNHIITVHRSFTCEICNFSCADISYLTDHFRVHTGEKPYACEKCNRRFSTKSTLTTHMGTWHRAVSTIPNIIEITLD